MRHFPLLYRVLSLQRAWKRLSADMNVCMLLTQFAYIPVVIYSWLKITGFFCLIHSTRIEQIWYPSKWAQLHLKLFATAGRIA